ncbi:MAG: type II toxin-antitoxin system HicA family toxin [Rhodocyclaceae bacterium]|nr:type II toxin-antitoxin system HicA family toxin [Rhodocyclaceae bacterium]MDP3036450.1 type II toxin-antitoxin system HicA family toxin [Rhodocyclaceae bacterium]
MKLPRDLSGPDLIRLLAKLGYAVTRQAGSHVRLTTQEHGEHHVTIPNHDPLKIGTLASILAAVAAHHGISRDELLIRLLG